MELSWTLLATLLAALVAGIYLGAQFIKREDGSSMVARLMTWLFGRRRPLPPPPEPEPEIIPPAPPPERAPQPLPANFGNIRPKLGEEDDLDTFGPSVHDFPEMGPPVTRYEDFNRKLFVYTPAGKTAFGSWVETTADDFPTRLKDFSESPLMDEIRRRLRPRYPVIFDTYGYWALASARLEQDPDYTDDFVQAYLAIPEHERPVVVSRVGFDKDGYFLFMRYGFEDFKVYMFRFNVFVQECLKLVMAAMIAPREQWTWFSVARMRNTAVTMVRANLERQRESEAATYLEEETRKAKAEAEHRNRFVALFHSRIPPTVARPGASDTPTAGTGATS